MDGSLRLSYMCIIQEVDFLSRKKNTPDDGIHYAISWRLLVTSADISIDEPVYLLCQCLSQK